MAPRSLEENFDTLNPRKREGHAQTTNKTTSCGSPGRKVR